MNVVRFGEKLLPEWRMSTRRDCLSIEGIGIVVEGYLGFVWTFPNPRFDLKSLELCLTHSPLQLHQLPPLRPPFQELPRQLLMQYYAMFEHVHRLLLRAFSDQTEAQ